jgi:hypothetical protein
LEKQLKGDPKPVKDLALMSEHLLRASFSFYNTITLEENRCGKIIPALFMILDHLWNHHPGFRTLF